MADGFLRSLLSCPWFRIWAGCIRHISVPVSPLPSFQTPQRLIISPSLESQLKSYLTTLMTSPLSQPSSFLLLGVSTCSSASFSVNLPKKSAPSALGAPRLKVFSRLPWTTARFSSTTTRLPQPFHLLARKRLTSCARTRLLLTDHGGVLKRGVLNRLDMDLEDKEKNQLLFVDSFYRSLLSRSRGI